MIARLVRQRRSARADQGGYILIASLIIMALVGLVIAALVALTGSTTATNSVLRERAERLRVADTALELTVTRIGKNYLDSQNPNNSTDLREQLERQEAELGKLSKACGPFTFTIDGRTAKVVCTPVYTPGSGETEAHEADCPGAPIWISGSGATAVCRPGGSPGLLRRVELVVTVTDKAGGNPRTFGVGRLTFADIDPATGKRSNGKSVSVEDWTLCNTVQSAPKCSTLP